MTSGFNINFDAKQRFGKRSLHAAVWLLGLDPLVTHDDSALLLLDHCNRKQNTSLSSVWKQWNLAFKIPIRRCTNLLLWYPWFHSGPTPTSWWDWFLRYVTYETLAVWICDCGTVIGPLQFQVGNAQLWRWHDDMSCNIWETPYGHVN